MQHQNKTKEFGRERNQRRALMKTMLGSLIMHEKITTGEAKAKELKNRIDKIITQAKKVSDDSKKLAVIRILGKSLPRESVKKITGDFIKKFEKRNSGYARVIKLTPRKSDGAKMAVIELIKD
jgi:large subunit ribosomal protein L17